MNKFVDRELFAQLVIAITVCVGGWMMLVQPQARKLQQVEATIAAARSNPLLTDQHAVEQMARELQVTRDHIRQIIDRNHHSNDSSQLYSLIMEAAARTDVAIQQFDPSATQTKDRAADQLRITVLEMGVTGTYENIARFTDAVSKLDGFIRPVTLSVRPMPGSNSATMAQARLSYEALSFNLPPTLAQLAETNNAHP